MDLLVDPHALSIVGLHGENRGAHVFLKCLLGLFDYDSGSIDYDNQKFTWVRLLVIITVYSPCSKDDIVADVCPSFHR